MVSSPLKPEAVKYIAVHCSATQPKQNVTAADIGRWHRQKGFLKIGYHFVIRRDGTVEKGREVSEVGAHVQGYNSQSLGICLVGGVDENLKAQNNFTPAQFDALTKLLKDLTQQFPQATVQGHRDFPKVNKDCPCFDVKQWWAGIPKGK